MKLILGDVPQVQLTKKRLGENKKRRRLPSADYKTEIEIEVELDSYKVGNVREDYINGSGIFNMESVSDLIITIFFLL